MRRVSKKRAKQLREYKPLSLQYLEDNPMCEVHDCSNPSNQVHHKRGRSGNRLLEVDFFMACCSSCHPRRIHETDVQWAKDHGYILLI